METEYDILNSTDNDLKIRFLKWRAERAEFFLNKIASETEDPFIREVAIYGLHTPIIFNPAGKWCPTDIKSISIKRPS